MEAGTGQAGGTVATGAWQRFCRDTAASARVWATDPRLPLLTLLLWFPVSMPGPWSLLVVPLLPFALGFCGMQREWYAAAFIGDRPSTRRIWRGTWRYVPRLLPIALVVLLFSFLTTFLLLPLVWLPIWPGVDSSFTAVQVLFVAQTFVVDLLLTFVMPALVFTTVSAPRALRIGWRYLRGAWSTVKWHVLVPPTALIVVGRFVDDGGGMLVGLVVSLAGVMLGLLFKGAQLRAYFDHAAELGVPIGGPNPVRPANR